VIDWPAKEEDEHDSHRHYCNNDAVMLGHRFGC
jgi:hypothetical protein